MCFVDVAFLPPRASFSTTFPKNCGRGGNLGTTTCLKNVVGGKQGHAPCRILLLQKKHLFVSVNFHEVEVNLATLIFGIFQDIKQW